MSNIDHIYDCFLDVRQKIATDTRKDVKDSLFICLSGGNFNGNAFAQRASELGAKYVVTTETGNNAFITVENPNQVLLDLSKHHASRLESKLIAIGGSNGKTTTKELISAVLSPSFRFQATPGNFNNHIGVPLTLLSLPLDLEIGAIELGTNHPGEMGVLCDLFKADIGIITNIGKEHLEGFEDLESIAREESELYLMLQRDNAIATVNMDDQWLGNMSKRLDQTISYSLYHRNADLYLNITQEMPQLHFEVFFKGENMGTFQSKIGGSYNAYNIAAAVTIGHYFGIAIRTAIDRCCAYEPNNNRSQWLINDKGQQIFLDAYNANPSSMELGLKSFSTITGSKTILLGDMLEMGAHSQGEHRSIFEIAQNLGFEDIYLVGSEFKKAVPSYPFVFETVESMLAWFDTHPVDSDYIFIKGSRGIAMERSLDYFDLSI